MSILTVSQVLTQSGVLHERYTKWSTGGIVITRANQLFGTWTDLNRGRRADPQYGIRWESHHILEEQDLKRLHIENLFPARDLQPCVLLPVEGHRRINDVLHRQNAWDLDKVTPEDLFRAYFDAYQLVGNYCGGGEAAIRQELLAIVKTIFRLAGVAGSPARNSVG